MTTDLKWPVTGVIRAIAMDAVQKANSGHPGTPMGMAEIAAVLWRKFIKHNPLNPNWVDRDRFVLSNGHSSILLYSVLHLTGYDIPVAELTRFRQLKSKTPGHPEYGVTPGVEVSTGPLGQGFANAVGMAIAERTLSATFNRPGHDIINHKTWVTVGDGCLMEGVSHEAASIAGYLKLNKLIAIYDDNGISIDGKVNEWFMDDTPSRFETYGWRVIHEVDGHDINDISNAFNLAIQSNDKPVLICTKTVIGKGAKSKEGTAAAHGSPLGETEIQKVRDVIEWYHLPFEIPQQVYDEWDCRKVGYNAEKLWNERFKAYKEAYPLLASELERRLSQKLPDGLEQTISSNLDSLQNNRINISTRHASQAAINVFAEVLPELIGGSADLSASTAIKHDYAVPITRDPKGNFIFYGVREFAMTCISNGIGLHGGFIPFAATFLAFSDYAKSAVRMSAMMRQPIVYIYTHDSIYVGEDGPTHQPVEQIWSLRLIPNLNVWRPCDQIETFTAWSEIIQRRHMGPSALLLSRQSLPTQERDSTQLENIKRGGYVLLDTRQEDETELTQAVIVATGSEVDLAIRAAKQLATEGIFTTVVSMPCLEIFEQQDNAYKCSVIPVTGLPVIIVEAGSAGGWWKYARTSGSILSVDNFGESAPQEELAETFGLTTKNVVNITKKTIDNAKSNRGAHVGF